MATLNTAQG